MIKIRKALASDMSFIFATWLKSYKGDSAFAKRINADIFFEEHHKLIEATLARDGTTAFIAHMEGEPDVILGYLIHEEKPYSKVSNVIHYVFVKKSCQMHGIARELWKSAVGLNLAVPVIVTHITYTISEYLKEKDFIIYNPYLF